MDASSEIREFLTSRRAKITPEQAGLRTYGGNRRVPGLRREEVALLAGVSVDYYTRLERGSAAGVSESVLEALARALQLDDAHGLVPHPAAGVGVFQGLVRPEIAAADAGARDRDESIGLLDETGIGDVLDTNVAGAVHDGCSHDGY